MIYRTKMVTFPHSGHHWLVRLLQHALGSEVRYSEKYLTGETLENAPAINLEKEHDFNGDAVIFPQCRYIVQIRQLAPALAGWGQGATGNVDLIRHVENQLPYYHRFIQKWVVSHIPNRLVVPYDTLRAEPVATVAAVLRHVADVGDSRAWAMAETAVEKDPPNNLA